MTRLSKQTRDRSRCPRKTKKPSPKTGPLKDNLPLGYKERTNALGAQTSVFIPKW